MVANSLSIVVIALWAISAGFPAFAEGRKSKDAPAVGGYGTYCFVNEHLKVECIKLSAFA